MEKNQIKYNLKIKISTEYFRLAYKQRNKQTKTTLKTKWWKWGF